MSALIVQYHPLDDSYNAALLATVVETLAASGRRHEVVRLGQGGEVDGGHLAACGHLIVVAPTWWGAMPARVQAWLQTELGPWIDGVGGTSADPARSPLGAVERLTVVTSHGSSRWINRLQGEPGRQLWRRSVLPLCRPGARFDWIALYGVDRAVEADRLEFIERVARSI